MDDVLASHGYLFLASRLRRLAERMQGDVLQIVQAAGLPIQPSQYPLLAALDRGGPMTVSDMVGVTGLSQPSVTRSLARLVQSGFVEMRRQDRDQRHKTVALTSAGEQAVAQSKQTVWPWVEGAALQLCANLDGALLEQVGALEQALVRQSLAARAGNLQARGLSILGFSDDRAADFRRINAQWISAMFTLEDTDRDVLDHPQARIIEPGGDILFVHADGIGIVGACALQKTGDRQFELTKMGVLEAARGKKAGEFLLRAMLQRAAALQARRLYLLTNSACAPAIHLYEKLGFQHDTGIMREFGARYRRCDVAMSYSRPLSGSLERGENAARAGGEG